MAQPEDSAREPLMPDDSAHGELGGRGDKTLKSFKAWMARPSVATLAVAVVLIGVSCGVVAFIYNSILMYFVRLTWQIVPERVVLPLWRHLTDKVAWWPSAPAWLALYTVLVSTLYGTVVGGSQRFMGSPGDLPDTIASLHKDGHVAYSQAPSMFVCSLFSVCAGGSLGPEAPLLTLCASTVSFLLQRLVPVNAQMMRYCTLLGMSAGLAAFFGVGMGGSLFALEVPHRMGLEYFEVSAYAVATGVVCLSVFRALSLLPFGAIWPFPEALAAAFSGQVLVGAAVGLLAALLAMAWTRATKAAKGALGRVGLDEHRNPLPCGVLGGLAVGLLGALLPPTMFWGEFELKTLADDTIPLAHIFPPGGVWGLAPFMQGHYTAWVYLLTGLVKLVAVSITLLAGFRGGFIFPLFACGTALGTALHMALATFLPMGGFPPVLFAMAFASGLNTAITRTPLATPLILTTLSGQANVAVPCLAAALVSLLVTKQTPFIMSQQSRADAKTILSSSSDAPGGNAHPEHIEWQRHTSALSLHAEDGPGMA